MPNNNNQHGTNPELYGQRFKDKVVLITGGGTGIGEACARRIAAEGGKVVVTGRRPEPITHVAKDIGGIAVAGDTADPEHVKAAVATAVNSFGGLDTLVVCAGAATFGTAENIDYETWKQNFAVNLDGAMFATQNAIPEMRKRGGGSIVLVSSMAALSGGPNSVPYFSSKAAMLGLNRSVAADFGHENIRCNAICPGWAPTDMSLHTLKSMVESNGGDFDQMLADIKRAIPLKRMGDPNEIAAAVAFLASSDASFMTGVSMIADGGANLIHGSVTPLIN